MQRERLLRIGFAGSALLGASLTCPVAAAQEERWRIHSDTRGEFIGEEIEWLDDVNGDSVADVALLSRYDGYAKHDPQNPNDEDWIEVVSGADFTTLRVLRSSAATLIGTALAQGGDHDRDGVRDLLVTRFLDGWSEAVVDVLSPATGELLRVYPIQGIDDCTLAALDSVSDADGDGIDEIVVGLPRVDHGGGAWGTIRVIASADGTQLAEWRGAEGFPDSLSNVGSETSLHRVPDTDFDGHDDLVWVEELRISSTSRHFDVRLHSGATFQELARATIATSQYFEIGAILGVDDLNGDGRGDVVVFTNHFPGGNDNYLVELSGNGLSTIRTATPDWATVDQCASLGDVNGDGRGDYAVSGVDWDTMDYVLVAAAGKTGALLTKIVIPIDPYDFYPLSDRLPRSQSRDVDGDAANDLLYGEPRHDTESRKVAILSTITDADVRSRTSDRSQWIVKELGFTSDLDGDQVNDCLARVHVVTATSAAPWLSFRNGRDGTELRSMVLSPDVNGIGDYARVGAIPDLNGDGTSDYAIVAQKDTGLRLTLRSGNDDQLIRSIQVNTDFHDRELELIAYVEPSDCAPTVALLSPSRAESGSGARFGRVTVLDLTSGTQRWSDGGPTQSDEFGGAGAVLPDLDGDGKRELAISSPGFHASGDLSRSGMVEIRAGANGALLDRIEAPAGAYDFGIRLATIHDVDGDDIDDLVVLTRSSPNRSGSFSAYSTASLSEFWRQDAEAVGAGEDKLLAPLADSSGDGSDEVLGGIDARSRLIAVSSRDGSLLGLQIRAFDFKPSLLISAPDWLPSDANGPATRFLALTDGPRKGAAVLSFPELWLTLDPESAPAGATVTADVRGGAPFALMGVMITAIDGVPFGQFGVLDLFDAAGGWSDIDAAPPELSGTTWSLQAFAVGFDGRMARSSVRELRFE